jgi:nucleoid DNA-binding protein
MVYNKKDLAREISKRSRRYLICEAEEWLDTVFGVIKEILSENDNIKIAGFGMFKVKNRAERESVNPRTGERIVIDGYRTVTFTPSKEFKKML